MRFTDIEFSPDGTRIAALARRWVYLWPVTAFDASESKPSFTKPAITVEVEGAGYCQSVAHSPDGTRLAVACNDGGVRIYETTTFELIKTIAVHKSAVSDVAFSPDGSRLATASFDKTFHFSPLRFDELYQVARRLRAATSSDEQGGQQ